MKEIIHRRKLRQFGIIIGFGFPILIGWLLPAIAGHSFRTWTIWPSIPGLVLSITSPSLLYYPYKVWMKTGHILGWVNSRIILGAVFILVLQPIAFVMRIFGYDPLRRRHNKDKSYRENRQGHPIDLTRIF